MPPRPHAAGGPPVARDSPARVGRSDRGLVRTDCAAVRFAPRSGPSRALRLAPDHHEPAAL